MAGNYFQVTLDKLPEAKRADSIEICINPDGSIWGEFQGDHFMSRLDTVWDTRQIGDLATQIAAAAETKISRDKPIVSCSVDYHGRAVHSQVIQDPVVRGGYSIALRFFSTMSLDDIKLKFLFGEEISLENNRKERNLELRKIVLAGDIDAAIKFCVDKRLNVIVSGGTSTGKTVACRKIINYIDEAERLITIEEAAELVPTQPNTVTLISNRDVPFQMADVLLTSTLRMRPDRIILGEVRGKEALTFLEAINTGHGGSMTTLHAETPQLAVQRLAIAALKTDVPMTYQDMIRYIESSIDVIIQAGRHEGNRGITQFYLPGETDQEGDGK